MATLSTIDFDDVKYESYILAGKRLAQHLKKVDVSTCLKLFCLFLRILKSSFLKRKLIL